EDDPAAGLQRREEAGDDADAVALALELGAEDVVAHLQLDGAFGLSRGEEPARRGRRLRVVAAQAERDGTQERRLAAAVVAEEDGLLRGGLRARRRGGGLGAAARRGGGSWGGSGVRIAQAGLGGDVRRLLAEAEVGEDRLQAVHAGAEEEDGPPGDDRRHEARQ